MNTLQFPGGADDDEPERSLPPPVVLIIDDSPTNRVVLEKKLLKLGCTVSMAANGREGLTEIKAGDIDLVLLDCQMPDMDGYEVARQARAHALAQGALARHVPIIAISGEADAAHLHRCHEAGMDGVQEKPLALATLHQLLCFWCGMRCAVPESGHTVREEMRNGLRGLYRSTSCDDFAQMRRCLERQDIVALRWLLHRMKGAALAIGAAHVVAVLERLEVMSVAGTMHSEDEWQSVLALLQRELLVI